MTTSSVVAATGVGTAPIWRVRVLALVPASWGALASWWRSVAAVVSAAGWRAAWLRRISSSWGTIIPHAPVVTPVTSFRWWAAASRVGSAAVVVRWSASALHSASTATASSQVGAVAFHVAPLATVEAKTFTELLGPVILSATAVASVAVTAVRTAPWVGSGPRVTPSVVVVTVKIWSAVTASSRWHIPAIVGPVTQPVALPALIIWSGALSSWSLAALSQFLT